MENATDSLIRDLLEWIGGEDRGYAETMDAWRTSCPRLPIWEEAHDRGFVTRAFVEGRAIVRLTPAGSAYLRQYRHARAVNLETPEAIRRR